MELLAIMIALAAVGILAYTVDALLPARTPGEHRSV
jgi:hypothetical protein